MDFSQERLRFYLLPSASPPESVGDLHDAAYALWCRVWGETFLKLGLPASGLDGEFVRQDFVACIAAGDVPLAVHLYSFFTLAAAAARAHPYLRDNYPELFFAKLRQAGVRTVMSMEYMTVHPDHRKSLGKLPVGNALGGLALTTMKHFGADAAIAPCRRDHKVHQLAYDYGGEPVIAEVLNHNVPCDLVMVKAARLGPHPNDVVQGLVDQLWANRLVVPSYHTPTPAESLAAPDNVIAFPHPRKVA